MSAPPPPLPSGDPPRLPNIGDLIAMLGDEEATSSIALRPAETASRDAAGEQDAPLDDAPARRPAFLAAARLPSAATPAPSRPPDFGFPLRSPADAAAAAPPPLADEPIPLPPLATPPASGTQTLLRRAEAAAEAGSGAPDYVFCQVIGEGGHGRVWRAWQTNLSREVAVKTLLKGDSRAFLREAYTSSELDHPNILPIYDLGRVEEEGASRLALAMKMVRGTPWNLLLDAERRDATFDAERFLARHLRILLDVCDAVAFAHSKGILHRDLKPHQVMVGRFGEVYLMDWGMALSLRDDVPPSHREGITKFNTRRNAKNQCGTPAYMAPEQTVEEIAPLGFHTDVYLLGAILFEIINAEPPHNAPTAAQAYDDAIHNRLRPMHDGCPEELRDLLRRTLATDPAERPAGAEAFRAALEEYLGGSGRRRESRQITDEVVAELADLTRPQLDYHALARFEQRIVRAVTLWPENRRAADVLVQLQVRHAERALGHDDLRLAESLLAALPDGHPERDRLGRRLAAARLLHRRQTLQRRAATLASLLLLVALAGLAVRHATEQGFAQVRLEAERDLARHARDRAEDLVNYMLTDLRRGLEPLGRLDLLEGVSRKSLAYYDKLPRQDVSPDNTRQRVVALHLVGAVLLRRGQAAGAQQAFTEALTLTRGLLARDPDHVPTLRLLAQGALHIGDVKVERGEPAAALSRYSEAVQVLDRLLRGAPDDDAPLLLLAAEARRRLAEARAGLGDTDAALALHRDALPLLERARTAAPDDPAPRFRTAVLHDGLGALLLARGAADDALAQHRAALADLADLALDHPDNADYRAAHARALERLADALAAGGDLAAAREALDAALVLRGDLAGRDPSDRVAREALAAARARRDALAADAGGEPRPAPDATAAGPADDDAPAAPLTAPR